MDLCAIGCCFMQMNAYFLVMNSKRCNSHKLFFWWCMDIFRTKLMLVTIGTYSEICCIVLCVLHILGFSVLSIILVDLLGNTCLLARVQKVMVCDSWLVDLDPFVCFVFQGSLLCDRPISGNNGLVKFASQIFMIFLILVTCKNKAMSASFLWQKIHLLSQFPSLFLSSRSHSHPSWASTLHCDLY